jgi:hypothetical protein
VSNQGRGKALDFCSSRVGVKYFGELLIQSGEKVPEASAVGCG